MVEYIKTELLPKFHSIRSFRSRTKVFAKVRKRLPSDGIAVGVAGGAQVLCRCVCRIAESTRKKSYRLPSAMAKAMANRLPSETANGMAKQRVSEGVSARQKLLCTDSEIRRLATGGVLIRKMCVIHRWKAMEVSFPNAPRITSIGAVTKKIWMKQSTVCRICDFQENK